MSKLYAIRDRLVDYYLKAFVAPSDKETIAAIAETINAGGTHAIQQTPHHFEIWRLAEINEETGAVIPSRELLADCASLVRAGIRPAAAGGNQEPDPPAGGRQSPPRGAPGDAGTDPGPVQGPAPTGPQAARASHTRHPAGPGQPGHSER